ncbi:uncharacterized protein PV09_04437 [Verruconis gallopava]|uniref:Outer spore wall protein RRT8 n=1 Tax=Verruconis gallopava TaxID=253628 RepID=A0A0D2B008_9PEZI|nr:uncharacterized protein PV09_04437 [Verruconis gallopava]KIW04704.1 hypothetical protein PV09_04437 [Verruconis gallopava]
MDKKVKEVAQEDAERIKMLAAQAIKSRAYLYPFKGILFFASHRDLWRPLMSRLTPTISTAVGVTSAMFMFTYVPQAAILTIFNGPLAIFSTMMLVLSESATITNVLTKSFFIQDALLDTFDGTLVARNQANIVAEGRDLKSGGDAMARLGKVMKKPFARFTPKAIIRYFMYLPLNFIPVVGTVIFLVLQGRKFGPQAHARYFQLKKMSNHRREEFVEQRKAAYTSFGITATLLEMVPFVGILFTFTNTVGAALWAADLEKENSTAPRLQEQAASASKSD